MFRYEFFTPIEGSDNDLVKLFNNFMKSLQMPRMIYSPDMRLPGGVIDPYTATGFYRLCVLEVYLHRVVHQLNEVLIVVERFNKEFEGKWKYYAVAERLQCIKEYGGEDEDYNEDGTINTKATNEMLIPYTITNTLNSIITNSMSPDDEVLHVAFEYAARSINIDFKDVFGKNVKTYRKDEDGKMVENTWSDDVIHRTEEHLAADELHEMIYSVIWDFHSIIKEIKVLEPCNDHSTFFKGLPKRINDLFSLKVNVRRIEGVRP